ncbi:phosphotransferase [Paracoccus liaowanqingii]|uniref:phosphotransferase n=1 Tax=Paracoccus liaowanqingii TaxID=2560053 RepID=UPI00143D9B7D|nr:phosphotransferase [Paracoccus liaowanqingii]
MSADLSPIAHLEALARKSPSFKNFKLESVVKSVPERIVVRGVLDGKPVYVKRLLGPRADQRIRGMMAELDFAVARMNDTDSRVAGFVAADPEAGLIALQLAPGRPMDAAIRLAQRERREQLLGMGGSWLTQFTRLRCRTVSFDAERTLGPLQDPTEITNPLDLARWQRLAAWQDERINELRGSKLSIAASHGDFHPGNLRVQGSTIHAFDIEGETWMPILRDCVTFLLHVQDHLPQTGSATHMGIAVDSALPFLSALDLSKDEKEQLLPVFMARRLANALVKRQQRPKILHFARFVTDNLLREMA